LAELVAQGRVVETRPGLIIIQVLPPQERAFRVRLHQEANPGDYAWVYSDGTVDVRTKTTVERAVDVPSRIEEPQQDHS
jgi:hypothetical protein